MELVTKLVLLLTLVGACWTIPVPCPVDCKCTKNSFGGAIARCTQLDPDIQQRFPADITHLVVENFLGERNLALTNMMFFDMGLEHVSTIKIVNSTLRDIHVNAFHGLKRLQEVDFSNNRLILIHPDTFKNNEELVRVVLKGNPLSLTQVLDAKGNHFLNSNSIRELVISNCRLTQIAPKTFSNLQNLELLDLSGNDLTEIKADTLANLINLEDLYLAYNAISKIDPDAFNDIEDLTKLSLKGNPIKTLESILVDGLAELDVSECDLEILAAASFEGFPELMTLNLSRNSIKDIDPETFSNLVNLRYLDLSYNMIRGPLDRNLFSSNKRLESLIFTGNKELRVFRHFVGAFPKLYHLDISNCGILEVIDDSFVNMAHIAKLNMSNNYMQHVRSHLLEPLTHLTVLDLSNNRIHYLNNKLFSTNKKLMKLSLANNVFRHVPAVVFQYIPALEWLDLSNCRLTTLWNITEAFILKNKHIFANLRYLNVSGNKLVKLHRHSFISMDNLEKLDISRNPIQCTSDFSHVMQWLIVKRVMPNKGVDSKQRPTDIGFIDNNIEWDDVLKVVCPINIQSVASPLASGEEEEPESEPIMKKLPHTTLFKNAEKDPVMTPIEIMEEPMSFQSPEEITKIEPIDEQNTLIWPMVLIWLSILSIFIAIGNLVGLLIYRSRRQYSVLRYRPQTFASNLETHFPVRRGIGGGRSPYQKLYEECSVPAPVHDNKIKFVSMIGNAFQKNNSKV